MEPVLTTVEEYRRLPEREAAEVPGPAAHVSGRGGVVYEIGDRIPLLFSNEIAVSGIFA